jgi:hypothetical protein
MTTDVFNEHLGVIQALRDNYARNEDAAAVSSLVRAQQEVSAACSQREKQVKETIKGEDRISPAVLHLGHDFRRRLLPCRRSVNLLCCLSFPHRADRPSAQDRERGSIPCARGCP